MFIMFLTILQAMFSCCSLKKAPQVANPPTAHKIRGLFFILKFHLDIYSLLLLYRYIQFIPSDITCILN